MILVGLERLAVFAEGHSDARNWIDNWIAATKEAKWKAPGDVKSQYKSVDNLPGGKGLIFNVKGNAYRMQVKVNYAAGVALVVRIATHKEYLRWTY